MVLTHRHLIEALVGVLLCQLIILSWRALLGQPGQSLIPVAISEPDVSTNHIELEIYKDIPYQVVVEQNNVLYSQGPYYKIKSTTDTYLVVDWLTDGQLNIKQFDITAEPTFNFNSVHFFMVGAEIYAWGLDEHNQITIFHQYEQKLERDATVTFDCNLASVAGKYLICTDKTQSVVYQLNNLTISTTLPQVATSWVSMGDILLATTYLEITPAGKDEIETYVSVSYYQFDPSTAEFNRFAPDVIPYHACEVALGGLVIPMYYNKCKREITSSQGYNPLNLPLESELLFTYGNGINGRIYLK